MFEYTIMYRLQELEDGIQPLQDRASPPPVQGPAATKPQPHPQPVVVEIESSSSHLPSLSPFVSPIAPPPISTQDLEQKLKLESRVIELQGRNKAEAETRRDLEQKMAVLESSRIEDMEARCQLEQQVYDLQESNRLYKEKVAQLLATPPLVIAITITVLIAHF